MPKIVRNISGHIINDVQSEIHYQLVGDYGLEDYINISGLIAYLQNSKNSKWWDNNRLLSSYGLKLDKEIIKLKIDY